MIQLARQGDLAPALSYLQSKAQHSQLTSNELADWIELYSWQQDNTAIIAIARQYTKDRHLPTRAYALLAKAFRNQQQWRDSATFWKKAIAAEPHNEDFYDGLAMTLADAGMIKQALKVIENRVKIIVTNQHYLTLAYIYQRADKPFAALESATKAIEQNPNNQYIVQTYVATLDSALANFASVKVAKQYPNYISPDELRRLQLNEARQQTRMAFMPIRGEKERFEIGLRALTTYNQLLTNWQDDPQAKVDYTQARIDRIGALVAVFQMQEAVNEYEILQTEQVEVPLYIKRRLGDAYLWLKQPNNATLFNSQVYSQNNEFNEYRVKDTVNLFESLVAADNLDSANKIAWLPLPPYEIKSYNLPVVAPNPDWQELQALRGQDFLIQDNLPKAQQLFSHLLSTAPMNNSLRTSLANIYRLRGWPRKAESELKIAESITPTDLYLEIEQGLTALELQEWKQMDLLADDVVKRQPELWSVRDFDKLRKVHHMYELKIDGAKTLKSQAPTTGEKAQSIRTRLYTPPLDDNWRLFTGWSFGSGDFDEGYGIKRGLLAGVEWSSRDQWAELSISKQNYGDNDKIGLHLATWYDLNDYWRIGGSAQRLSNNTPLRALKNKITANGGDIWIRYQPNERAEWQFTVAPLDFSDGNQRVEYSIAGLQNIWTAPKSKLDFTLALGASHNTRDNVPYYNPKRDLTIVPGLLLENTLYRFYETTWSQQVGMGAGYYIEKNYNAGTITQLSYGQRLKWNNVVDMGATLSWSRQPYDGTQEQDYELTFDLSYRF